jgi:predicted RNA methylase
MFQVKNAFFTDKQKAHIQFWNRYERPPKEEYWDYIVERRDLLVPQDVRERKGSFFTPQIWVELSQKYLTDVLGEDWQDEYYIWDCAAGTGNLLAGLTNKYNIWASTLDKQDVEVMNDRIKNGANLLEDHVFQFDFLNDEFTKLPKPLQAIINDPEKRKKLVVYINPPYAEAGSTVKGDAKTKVSNQTMIHKKYESVIDDFAKRELFIQFFTRIYAEIPGAIIAQFSKLKIIQAPYFSGFRKYFLAELKSMFVVPANSFDNVKGSFPIGFFIWNTDKPVLFTKAESHIYNKDGIKVGKKTFYSFDGVRNINEWLRPTWKNAKDRIGFLTCNSNDFQHQNEVVIQTKKSNDTSTFYKPVTNENLIKSCIYFAVRKVIDATWLNDRDQFLYPNDGWIIDTEFQNDCLTYTLFHNNIQSKFGTNHWIPFTEYQVGSREKFDSNFMTDFIAGKIEKNVVSEPTLFEKSTSSRTTPLEFSHEAIEVFNAGRELWKYYHKQPNCNVNASLYDIRAHFQARDAKGKMNSSSTDETYMLLIRKLREQIKILAKKIEPKVYEYGFLKV